MMLRYLKITLSLLLILFCLTKCTRPYSVLSRDEMKAVTQDLLLVEAICQYKYLPDTTMALYYESVFAKHGISRAKYDSSLVWYGQNAPLLADIYAEIGGTLIEKKNQADSAFVDSTQWVRVRYQPHPSAWDDDQQRIYIDGRKMFDLLYSKELNYRQLEPLWEAKDTLFWSAVATPNLSADEHLWLHLYIKDDEGYILHKLTTPIIQDSLYCTAQIVLPDSLPETPLYHLHLIYSTDSNKALPHLLQRISLKSIKVDAQSPEAEAPTEEVTQEDKLTSQSENSRLDSLITL